MEPLLRADFGVHCRYIEDVSVGRVGEREALQHGVEGLWSVLKVEGSA